MTDTEFSNLGYTPYDIDNSKEKGKEKKNFKILCQLSSNLNMDESLNFQKSKQV